MKKVIILFLLLFSCSSFKGKTILDDKNISYLDSVAKVFLNNPSAIDRSLLLNNMIFISQDYWLYAHKDVDKLKTKWKFFNSDWSNPKFDHSTFMEYFETYGKKQCYLFYTKNSEWEVNIKFYNHNDHIVLGSISAWSLKTNK